MQENKDRHLDVPAEANRDNHINFLEQEEKASRRKDTEKEQADEKDRQRREAWQQGLAEGEKEKMNSRETS